MFKKFGYIISNFNIEFSRRTKRGEGVKAAGH